jgi:cobalamin transport system substrate-binding protein
LSKGSLRLFFAAALAIQIACSTGRGPIDSGQDVATQQREFTDALNRRVKVSYPPRRIVSLAPNLTEIVFALGAADRLAGVTSYCDYPPAARDKEKVGDTIQPNLEKIIGLKPDLVLISTSSQLEQITSRLDQLTIPVYVTGPRTVAEVVSSIRALGEVIDALEKATDLADSMDRRISHVKEQVRNLSRPRVLYVLQIGPLITVGSRTFINDLLTLAGSDSISASEAADYPQFSLETVIARAPEVIVAPTSHGGGGPSDEELAKAFAPTPAIRNRRIVRVNPDLVTRPGPRIIDGLEGLARDLHER